MQNGLFAKVAQYSQFWREEVDVFKMLLRQLPENPVVVEIGTADGASAALLCDMLGEGSHITSIDVAFSDVAHSVLRNAPVQLVTADSVEFSARYKQDEKFRKIDLLFIDGDHTLHGAYRDLQAWLPLTDEDGIVVFHDYDPPERGGVAHFGIQIFLDTIIGGGFFPDMRLEEGIIHSYRILSLPAKIGITIPHVDAMRETLVRHGRKIQLALENIDSLGSEKTTELLFLPPAKNCGWNELEMCYVVDHLRKNNQSILFSESKSRKKALKFHETLQMLEHSYGQYMFPAAIPEFDNVEELSVFLSKEQVRLALLNEIREHIYCRPKDVCRA